MKMKSILLCALALGGACAFGGEAKEPVKSTTTANTQRPDDGRPQRPNGLNDVDRKNLPKLWSAPGVKEHVLKRMDGGDDLVFVECPPGDFTMGFREGNGSAFSKHRVTLTYPFWMLKTQLTWGQFYMPGVSGRNKGDRHGCNSFSCEQMAVYLHCLNDKYASQIPEGYVIRFPTFAEYQYAYRANSKDPSDPYTHDAFVGDERRRICHDNGTRKGWNRNRRTWPRVWPAEVGLLEPNAWGLYDMCGNGFTYLCDRVNPDLSDTNHYSFPEHETDPIIYEEDAGRMLMRGGDSPDWLYKDFFCTWRWAFTCRLVVGPDLEKKGREQMERTSQARHDAAFAAMTDGLAKRKHGPTELLGRKTVRLFPGCEMEFVQCPSGSFTMGHEAGDGPFRRREVTISRPFYIATERLTFGVWFKYLEATGRVVPEEQRAIARKRGGERCALCGLKDEDWNGFLAWLNDRCASELKESVFRLPTEAEWEYAYRAGASRQDDPFAWTVPFLGRQAGAAAPFAYTEDERRQDFIRFGRGSVTETSWDAYTADWRRKMLVAPGQVGTKKANAWGLKDMIGNGREWVLDRFCCAAGKFPAETYGQLPGEVDPLFGYELDKWDCQMCRGGDDGYAGRKCWDANGSGWGEDTWYPKEQFCYRLVIGQDLIHEKRGKTTTNACAVSAAAQGLQPRRTLGSRLARPAASAVQGQGSCIVRQNVTTDTVLDFKGICFRSLLGINDEVLADTNRFSYAKDWIPAIELGERFGDFTNATVMVRKDRNTGKLALSDVKFVKALGSEADEKALLKEYEHAVDLVCKLLGVNVTCPGLVDPATYLRRRFLLPMDRRIKSRICLNLAKGHRVEIEATEASYIIRAGQPMQTGAPTVEIKFAYNGSFGVRRSGGQDSESVKELTLGTDCSDLLSDRMKALPEQQRQRLQLIQEELKRAREAKAAATKSECAASCPTSKSSTEKISVAEKLGQCDFLLNMDFKKNAKVYLCLFSASWCPPCRREMPRIAKTYAETLKGDPDIELIHFSRDQNDEKAMAWAKEHDVKFPVVKPKGGNPLDLHCNGIPHLFIVKADGTLVEEGHPMRIFNEEKFRELKAAHAGETK